MPPQAVPVEVRVWRHIDKRGADECWPWTGATNRGPNMRGGPYGKVGGNDRRTVYPHRVVYETEVAPLRPGQQVDHLCNDTLCCNPAHLEATTPRANNARSQSATSLNMRKTHCPQGHEYTPENTGHRRAKGYRYCRACARLSQRAKRNHGMTYPEWLASLT